MNYHCVFDTIDKKGVFAASTHVEACFSRVYRYLDKYSEIHVHVLKQYGDKYSSNGLKVTDIQFKEYIQDLIDIGFKLFFTDIGNQYVIRVTVDNIHATKVVLNAIRYAYEYHTSWILASYFKIKSKAKSEKIDMHNWNILSLAHSIDRKNLHEGHSYEKMYRSLKPLTEKEFSESVLNQIIPLESSTMVPHLKNPLEHHELTKLFNSSTLKETLKLYNELCEKSL